MCRMPPPFETFHIPWLISDKFNHQVKHIYFVLVMKPMHAEATWHRLSGKAPPIG